jgi:hypothetical protein
MVFHAGQAMTPKMGCSLRPRRAFLFNPAICSIKFAAVLKYHLKTLGSTCLKQFPVTDSGNSFIHPPLP